MTTTRSITAAYDGPVVLNATLLGHGGRITVRAEAGCERATLTLATPDESGAAADAVREATLKQCEDGLTAHVEGQGGAGTTLVTGGGSFHFGSNSGVIIGGNSVVGNVVNGGDVVVVGGRVVSGNVTVGASSIEITAIVPEGSQVVAETQSADVDTLGALQSVSAHTQSGSTRTVTATKVVARTQSGSIRVGRADNIQANTQSGAIHLERTDVVSARTQSGSITVTDFGGTAGLETQSGAIRVHATAGGDLSARTMTGAIDVTATEAALADDLDVEASSMTGSVRTPQRHTGNPGVRRRR